MRAPLIDVLYDTMELTPPSMVMRALPSEKSVLPSDALHNVSEVRARGLKIANEACELARPCAVVRVAGS